MVSRRATFTLPLLAAALLLFLPVSSSLQSRPAPSLKKEVNQAADAAPRDLMAAFHAARYAVNEEPKVVELGGKPGLVAYSRKQNVRALFAKDGVRVQTTGAAKSRPNVRLTPTALQRGAESQPLPAAAAPKRRENRVEYSRGPVTEWYMNDKRGLEQGFSIAECGTRNAEWESPIPHPG